MAESSEEEQRPAADQSPQQQPHQKQVCMLWQDGLCPLGSYCAYVHGSVKCPQGADCRLQPLGLCSKLHPQVEGELGFSATVGFPVVDTERDALPAFSLNAAYNVTRARADLLSKLDTTQAAVSSARAAAVRQAAADMHAQASSSTQNATTAAAAAAAVAASATNTTSSQSGGNSNTTNGSTNSKPASSINNTSNTTVSPSNRSSSNNNNNSSGGGGGGHDGLPPVRF
eukprot:m.15815 g.15815  ORF g.15815 m.15815 type:complete len:228 (+) comp7472_c0_seq1:15-698(+)